MITAPQAAEILGLSARRVRYLLLHGRFRGAQKVGQGKGYWLIPVYEGKPVVLTAPRYRKGKGKR